MDHKDYPVYLWTVPPVIGLNLWSICLVVYLHRFWLRQPYTWVDWTGTSGYWVIRVGPIQVSRR